MELSLICLQQIMVMFLLVATGFLCGKLGIIDKATNPKLSAFLLYVVNPVLIVMSYQEQTFSMELLRGLGLSIALAAGSYALIMAVLFIIFRKDDSDNSVIVKFSSTFSNCGFMGLPLINALFGSEGVLYVTGYLTIFNIMCWTYGVMMFGGKESANLKKIITSPAIIAIIIGLICFVAQIHLPQIILSAGDHIKACNTPVAMICAGVTIAYTDIKQNIKDKYVYLALLLRLILCPLLFWAVFRWFAIPHMVFMVILVASGCPAAATGTMLALNYKKNPEMSAVIFAASTLLSALTLPLVVMLGSI